MVFIPIRDINKRILVRYQFVTLFFVIGCSAVFFWQWTLPPEDAENIWYGLGFVPSAAFGDDALSSELEMVPPLLTLVTSMFLHGSWVHVLGNMMFLWVFGDNVEDAMGHRRFLAFFVMCGVAGAAAHGISDPTSDVPMVGASGAVSGILGAYFVLHPRVRVWVLFILPIPLRLPTWLIIGSWFAMNALYAVYGDAAHSGIAWWAHVGGFAFGAVAIAFFKREHVPLFDMTVGTTKKLPSTTARRNR